MRLVSEDWPLTETRPPQARDPWVPCARRRGVPQKDEQKSPEIHDPRVTPKRPQESLRVRAPAGHQSTASCPFLCNQENADTRPSTVPPALRAGYSCPH